MACRIKLLIVVSHPIQYFVPVFKNLAARAELDLLVIYHHRAGLDKYHDPGFGQAVQWDIPLLDGYKYEFLSTAHRAKLIDWRIAQSLYRFRPNAVIIHGYNTATNVLAAAMAILLRASCVLRGDTKLARDHSGASLKALCKQFLFRLFDGFLSIGTLNDQYYKAHGVPGERIFFAPFCVSNESFALSGAEASLRREQIRTSLSIPSSAKVVLFASKLQPRKRAADLLHAYGELSDMRGVHLVIAGSGEQEMALRLLCQKLDLKNVHFVGFQNQSRLPSLFAAADVFVLPASSEPWGLVINEAMAAGLPVIVSDEVGAAPDLVAAKGTGVVFRCGDIPALALALRGILQDDSARKSMAENARMLIQGWSIEKCAELTSAAVQDVLQLRKRYVR
jgi:glycosyltransferase involved in cell wall biosynthesis